MKYIIHTYPKRLWYVTGFLIPSMLEQGVVPDDIEVWNDDTGKGNLESCMQCFQSRPEEGGTWHLQDDIVISANFKVATEQHDEGVVCGFNSALDKWGSGKVYPKKMWWSFPCIRIPNEVAKKCSEWYYKYMENNQVYSHILKIGKNDDWVFKKYLENEYPNELVLNLAPNIVDHIDYLIGGSSINPNRENKKVISICRDSNLDKKVEELKKKLGDSGVKV